MSQIGAAFQAFFSILFSNTLPESVALAFGYQRAAAAKVKPAKAEPPTPPAPGPADGAIQLLTILQRDARLVDFLMEDISAYADDQVGAAIRTLHQDCRASLERYVKLSPIVDGVEGTFHTAAGEAISRGELKLIGNVPPDGKASGGTLRHRGWKVDKTELPVISHPREVRVLAPAELEIE